MAVTREDRSDAPGRPVAPSLPPVTDAGDLGAIALEHLAELRERSEAWHHRGAGGSAVVAFFTASIDELIRFLFDAASHSWRKRYVQGGEEIAVFAQGGYGRAELNPYSDIDLLVLHPHKVTPYAEATTEAILYALWDARLQVGHAVRNVRDCTRLAATDLRVKTALLDARFLCGSREISGEFDVAFDREIVARGATRFFREKILESESRHREFGESVYLLEPQIKEGRGGLRDLHTALWIAKVQYRVRSLGDLVTVGVISAEDYGEILEATDFLFRVRNSMHFLTHNHSDQLTFELQDQVAEDLGYGKVEPESFEPVESFLQDYYRRASVITRFTTSLIEGVENPSPQHRLIGKVMARTIRDGVQIVSNQLVVRDSKLFEEDPIELIRVVRDAQRHGVKLASEVAGLLRENAHLLGAKERDDPRVADMFMAILGASWGVYDAVHMLHRVGILERILPEWEHLLCLVRRNHFHIYTVDEHSLMGIRELERLRSGEWETTLPLLTQVMREVENPSLLFLAMMLHDIGKGSGGDHSEIGSKMADEIGGRLGLDEDDRTELRFLVRNHLVMALFAEQRDVNDEKTALDLAKIVGTQGTLRRLFLLTYADMRSTNPKMWNNWKDLVLGETYMRISEVFSRGFAPEDRAARLARIRERVISAAEQGGALAAATPIATFLDSMPEAYLLSTPEAAMPDHAALIRRASEEGIATSVSHHPERDFTEFTVAAPDRPGLFVTLTGVLAASGLNVLTAKISTSTGGIVLDSFRVSHAGGGELAMDDQRWVRLVEFLREVLAGREDLSERLARQRTGLLRRRETRRAITAIVIDDTSSNDYLVLDVYAPDRMGLLHCVAEAIHDLDLRIHRAKIATNVDQAVDIFFVSELDGGKPDRDGEIRAALNAALERFDAMQRDPVAGQEGSGTTV